MKIMTQLCLITATTLIAATLNVSAADGSAIYTKECAKCHGADGKGETPMGKKLSIKNLAADQAKLSDAQIEKSIKDGLKEGDKVRMKPIAGLSDADAQAVVKYVRTLKK